MMRSISDLVRKFGEPQRVLRPLPSIEFPPLNERKHGEVCMAILRRNGTFLLQTKKSYPNAVMRLPSGGIKAGEDIEHALRREVWEETNLDIHVERFVALLGYRAEHGHAAFQTYLFLLRDMGGELRSNDPSEKITDWREARPNELIVYASTLAGIETSWRNWGLFRAAALEVLADYCARNGV
jgi:ADP-ribose pyrophosphatase YjhB (NUDIX family)